MTPRPTSLQWIGIGIASVAGMFVGLWAILGSYFCFIGGAANATPDQSLRPWGCVLLAAGMASCIAGPVTVAWLTGRSGIGRALVVAAVGAYVVVTPIAWNTAF